MKNIIPENRKGINMNSANAAGGMRILVVFLIILVVVNAIVPEEADKKVVSDNPNSIKVNPARDTLEEEKENEIEVEKITTGLESVRTPSKEDDFFIVSTLEGNIHAYSAGSNEPLWKINLGKPLVTSNFQSKNILFDKNAIIPGLDGHIYYYSNNEEKGSTLKKIDIPFKTLIDTVPFFYPNIPNYMFLGHKTTSMYTIDVETGLVVSKFPNDEEKLPQNLSVKSNPDNLLTIIRTDYTLICIDDQSKTQSWNATVSEVIAIQKGTKSDIEIRSTNELEKDSGYKNVIKQRELADKIQDLLENSGLNSVVSVHKYGGKTTLPVKVYDVNPDNEGTDEGNDNNFIEYMNEKYSNKEDLEKAVKDIDDSYNNYSEFNHNFYEMLADYLKWTKEKIKTNRGFIQSNTFFHFLIFKFWELYYFEDYFLVYMTTIFFLIIIVMILLSIVIRFAKKNFALKNKIRKLSDEKKSLTTLCNIPWSSEAENVDKSQRKGSESDQLSYDKEFKLKEEEGEQTTALALYNENWRLPLKKVDNNKENEFELMIEEVKDNKHGIEERQLQSAEFEDKKANQLSLRQIGPSFGNAVDFQRNRLIDLGLQDLQKETVTKTDVKFYQNEDGSFIQEENHTIITKFENCQEVEQKVNQLKFQVDEIRKSMIPDTKEIKSGGTPNIPPLKNRKMSFDILNSNFDNSKSNKNSSKELTNYQNKTGRSRSKDLDIKKMKVNFSVTVKKTKAETQVMIDNKDSGEINTETGGDKIENSLTNNQNENKLSISRKENSNSILTSQSSSMPPLHQEHKHKRKYKEYCKIHNGKINTTHIDEGRLDKTFEEIEKIGQGGFGCVFKARHKIDGSYYAIKMIELKVGLSQNLMDHKVIKEVKTMMKLNHKNVVRYTTCWFQLKIESVQNMIDMSKITSSEAYTVTVTNNHSVSRSYTYNYSRQKVGYQNKNRLTLNEITENEEKSSIKSKSGFNWDESVTINGNNDDVELNNNDKAFSLSLEKADEESNLSHEDCLEEIEANKTNSLVSIGNPANNKNKNSFALDDSFNPKKHRGEPMYKVYFFMQMEFCDGLPLNLFLENNKEQGLERKLIFNFFKQIASGVNHIHKNNVIHRDLKPHNIFIFGKNSLKIGDFGLATEMSTREKNKANISLTQYNSGNSGNPPLISQCVHNMTMDSVKLSEFVGTPLYQSPEQIEGLAYNQKVDIFAMGLILYELCSAFKTGMERRESIEKLKNEHRLNENIKEKYPLESHLILWMTNKKPCERPTAQEILDSDIFKKIKSEQEIS